MCRRYDKDMDLGVSGNSCKNMLRVMVALIPGKLKMQNPYSPLTEHARLVLEIIGHPCLKIYISCLHFSLFISKDLYCFKNKSKTYRDID